MADIYDVLIGEAPTKREQAAELAAALRRRRSYGELGVLTGDKVLSGLGSNMLKSADDYAQQIQDIRQKDIDNAQTQSYQTGQLGHMGRVADEANRHNLEQERLTERGQDLSYLAALERAKAAAARSSIPKPAKLTYADRNKLENFSNLRTGTRGLLDTFEDGFSQTMSGKLVPELGQSRLANTLATYGAGTKEQKKAADWWTNWNVLYTLPQRNATFGATLTPHEKEAWFGSDINPSMTPQQIRSRIQTIYDIIDRKAALAAKTYRAQGFDPQAIDAYELDSPSSGSAAPQADEDDTGEAPLSPEEQAEYERLRKKYGR